MKKVFLIIFSLVLALATSYGCATRKDSAINENEAIFPSVKSDHAKHDRGIMEDALLMNSPDKRIADAD